MDLPFSGIIIILCKLLREVIMANFLFGILIIRVLRILFILSVISSFIKRKFKMLVLIIFMILYLLHVMMLDTRLFGIWENPISQFILCKIIKELFIHYSFHQFINIYGHLEERIKSLKFGTSEIQTNHYFNGKLENKEFLTWDGLVTIKQLYGQQMAN